MSPASSLILLLLSCCVGSISFGQEFDLPFKPHSAPELSAEEKARTTPELFAALLSIVHQPDRVTSNKYNDLEDAFWRELSERDRASHEWLAERMLTTTDQKEAHRAMTLLTDSYVTRKPKHLDIAREAVIAGVSRSLRKEEGRADRVLLVAAFLDVGQPGDFHILAPFLEGAGQDLASTLYQVASKVIGTEEDIPLLRHYAERWQKEAEHVSPSERASRRNKANFAFASIRRLEERLAAEAAVSVQSNESQTPPIADAPVRVITEKQIETAVHLERKGSQKGLAACIIAIFGLVVAASAVFIARRRTKAQ